jgi:hypothetical protein
MLLKFTLVLALLSITGCERSGNKADAEMPPQASIEKVGSSKSRQVVLHGYAIATIHGVCITESIASRDCLFVELSEKTSRSENMKAFDQLVAEQVRGKPIYVKGSFSGSEESGPRGEKYFVLYDVISFAVVNDAGRMQDESEK